MSETLAAPASPPLPGSLKSNPTLSRWLRFQSDGTVEVMPGKVEIGQGILTALCQIAADELDVEIGRIRLVPANTAHSPNEGVTSGSQSVQHSGIALRYACAEVRRIFLEAAARRLGVSAEDLRLDDGVFFGPGNAQTSYWDLFDAVPLDRPATASVAPKPVEARRIAGRSVQRFDIADKVFGAPRFIHDLAFPDLLHARMIRSCSPGARLEDVPEESIRDIEGFAAVVRDGNFLGVLAESEDAATRAADRLRSRIRWKDEATLPAIGELNDWLKSAPVETSTIDEKRSGGEAVATRTVSRRYSRPYLAHASIGPSCAIARWTDGRLHVWTHSQGIFNLRSDLSLVFAMAPEDIIVEHVQGAGCYGHNGADDAALDAAIIARSAGGRPVRLQWSREEELGRAPFGAAMVVEIEAGLDDAGAIRHWRHEIWSNGHTCRPGRSGNPVLLAASEISDGFERPVSVNPKPPSSGADRNAIPLYDFPNWDIVSHRLLVMPLRTSSLRSLGAFANVFAVESFLDEIAAECGEDPLEFRLRHLRDERARDVLEAAAAGADWGTPVSGEASGRGIAYARYKNNGAYCAVAAEVDCLDEVRVKRLSIAVDVGEVINPDGVANQIEGGAIQAASWTIKESVTFDRHGVTSSSWGNYPILRFSEVPSVSVEVIHRPDLPALGAGEASQGPTAGAIANAVHDALGIRVRELPITRERLIEAMR